MADSTDKGTHEARSRIGVLGASGQLGRCLVRGIERTDDLELAFGVTRDEIDLTASEAIGPWLDSQGSSLPDVVINAAAYTKVDSCESEAELAYQTNALAPAEWARELSKRGIRFIHVSTDYVFPGDGDQPYREEDPTDPKSVYGASKRAGEIAVLETDPMALVVRTSWVFGPGRNFVVAILDQAARRRTGELEGPLRVVDDQQGAPTYAADLAEALLELCRRRQGQSDFASGLLHLRNSDETTWYGFARAILDQAGYGDIEIDPVPSSTFETAAPRPVYSVLNCDRAARLGIVLRPWSEALAGYLSGPDVPASLLPGQCSTARESAREEVSR
jgi:dTDP-4-dehydrorhamnose reductase